jgi:acid phosphatase
VLGNILKMQSFITVMFTAASMAVAQTVQTSEPTLPEIQAAAATTLPLSPTSNVKGVAFDRFIQVWLENTVSKITAVLT